MRLVTRQALRNGFSSAAAQTVAHDLSKQFSMLLGTYVSPNSFCFNEARGYWAQSYQDVKRIDGHFRAGDVNYSFYTWDWTLSALARSGVHIVDERGNRMAEAMFRLEKGRGPVERDDSDEWYSDAQLEEIRHREQGAL